MTAAGYQVLVKLIKPYTRIGIEFIGAQVNKERNQRDAGQARSGGGHLFGPAPASLAQHNTPEGRHNVVTTLFQETAARLVNGWLDRAASSWHHHEAHLRRGAVRSSTSRPTTSSRSASR